MYTPFGGGLYDSHVWNSSTVKILMKKQAGGSLYKSSSQNTQCGGIQHWHCWQLLYSQLIWYIFNVGTGNSCCFEIWPPIVGVSILKVPCVRCKMGANTRSDRNSDHYFHNEVLLGRAALIIKLGDLALDLGYYYT